MTGDWRISRYLRVVNCIFAWNTKCFIHAAAVFTINGILLLWAYWVRHAASSSFKFWQIILGLDFAGYMQGHCWLINMTSLNGNNIRVTGSLCGKIHLSPMNSPHKGLWRGASMFSLICAWTNGWVNTRDAVDLRRHRAYYDVTTTKA